MENSLKSYNSPEIVEFYFQYRDYTKPELAIFERFRGDFPEMKLLEIGIGGGRITDYLAPRVKEFTGIDYSENMVKACKQRFKKHKENFNLFHCDARDMSMFEDRSFDFIFFSFNGIDFADYDDRIKVFKEIIRVGKEKAYFYFSTHNLQNMSKFLSLSFHLPKNPLKWISAIKFYKLARKYNGSPSTYDNKKYAIIKDGGHNFGIDSFYIKPIEQINQLKMLRFQDIEVYSLGEGKILKEENELKKNDDYWLYYLCKIIH